jgi:hypothetical protein
MNKTDEPGFDRDADVLIVEQPAASLFEKCIHPMQVQSLFSCGRSFAAVVMTKICASL